MKKLRKIIFALIIFCYLLMLPPLNGIFNKPVLLFGMPMFMTVLIIDSLTLAILMLILYKFENKINGDDK